MMTDEFEERCPSCTKLMSEHAEPCLSPIEQEWQEYHHAFNEEVKAEVLAGRVDPTQRPDLLGILTSITIKRLFRMDKRVKALEEGRVEPPDEDDTTPQRKGLIETP